MVSVATYCKGDEVFVFYRMGGRCHPERKYMAVRDSRHGSYRPRSGLSVGWLPARVVHKDGADGDDVYIEYRWPYFATKRGHVSCASEESWTERYRAASIRRMPPMSSLSPGLMRADNENINATCMGFAKELVMPGSQPKLAIIEFRWGGRNNCAASEQWGLTGSPVSDSFLEMFLDMAVEPSLGKDYEVWTTYLEDSSDMVRLADAAHFIFGCDHPARRALHTCAMYFLYPTAFEENCIPNHQTGGDHGAALMDHKALFRLMQAVERAGVPTRFPHASGLYEQLTSKRWTYQLSVVPHLRVPPTVAVPRMLIERSCKDAAEQGLKMLGSIKQHQSALRGIDTNAGDVTVGVAKLGFSWEALDVKFWEGSDGLASALYELTQAIEISGEMTGQPHNCEALIVQEFVRHDLELRVYVVDGSVEKFIYTKFCCIKDNHEFGDFKQLASRADAAESWMGGDVAALEDGERQCLELVDHWLQWVLAQACEMPPAVRFDFFVGRRPDSAGKADVWTLEIC